MSLETGRRSGCGAGFRITRALSRTRTGVTDKKTWGEVEHSLSVERRRFHHAGSSPGARERQNVKAIIKTYVSRNDSPVLELNHVDSDSPRFASDVDHMRRPAFPSSGWAPVPNGDKRHFWGVV